ncbi:hypothetical protein Aple_002560 [Acrocarpospora pleiomorpha]|uniref:Uncharacterized protein n=2 Tax=Acrocarpospora pleiomorpha TaxID=90975 RepID=A0A5M3XCW8_9ACTN|nr:hypothetical protein [Acrocarpospora pleiomorpha]GES17361.1 hypothetical protein Aple_002560 [Acrocarpospora pleiomorpha]
MAAVAAVLLIGGFAMFLGLSSGQAPNPSAVPTPASSPPAAALTSTGYVPFFPPRTHQGQGPALLRIDPTTGQGLITLTHAGSANFVVTTVDAAGAELDLVNATGHYEGTRLIGSDNSQIIALRIQADGAWTATTKPLLDAQVWNGPTIQGQGDQVLRLDRPIGRHTPARASHPSKGVFIVHVIGDSTELQIDADDAFSGEFLLKTGTTFVDIHADGPWTLSRN